MTIGNKYNPPPGIPRREKGAVNGVATLDSSGFIPESQIPLKFVEFQGNWDASTNTPTLANTDIGAKGNVYNVSVAGTVDFGAGPIEFRISDWVFNDGIQWVKREATNIDWFPAQLPFGSLYFIGTSVFSNAPGPGIYASMRGNQDDVIFFNTLLVSPVNGIPYDGSDLIIVLHGKLSTDGGVGDNIGFVLQHNLVADGDNSSAIGTLEAQLNTDVSTKLANIDCEILLPTITGQVLKTELLIRCTRNGSGTGQDSYTGDFRLMGVELRKA